MDHRLARMRVSPHSLEPRFYPPGMHPATAKLRLQLKKAEALDLIVEGSSEQLNEFLAYLYDEIAKFEEGESERKAIVYQMITRDKKGRR